MIIIGERKSVKLLNLPFDNFQQIRYPTVPCLSASHHATLIYLWGPVRLHKKKCAPMPPRPALALAEPAARLRYLRDDNVFQPFLNPRHPEGHL